MNLKLNINYSVTKTLSKEGVLSVPVKELEDYISEFPPTNIEQLEEIICDFIHDYDYDFDQFDLDIQNVIDWKILDCFLLNVKEIAQQFLHLIVPIICCEEAPYNAIYCPTCGKKLR